MVGDRRRKCLDGSERLKVEDGRPAGDRSAGAETPHEARLWISVDAARTDAIVIAGGAIAVKAKMDRILSKRSVPADQRCRRP
jgi:hypothetical protein